MKWKVKYIGLIIGLLSSLLSFLFFGRKQETYQLLLLIGCLTSLVFLLLILFSKKSIKTKALWSAVVLFAVFINSVTEPILIKKSYLIFLKQNDNELRAVNNILIAKHGDLSILNNDVLYRNCVLTTSEKNFLLKASKKLNVYIITKTDAGVYFGLWGFLDVRLGIIYWTKNANPDSSYEHLKDKWYH